MPDERTHRNPGELSDKDDAGSPAEQDRRDEPTARIYTRRGLLTLGGVVGGGLVASALVAEALTTSDRRGSTGSGATASPTPTPHPARPRTFVSTDLTTSRATARQTGETGPGLLLVQPQATGFNGVIMDSSGEPVWIASTSLNLTDLRVQEYQGQPVLTYWSGRSVSGHGVGVCSILDQTYREIATVQAAPGMQADLHEFVLTSRGTALLTAYPTVSADLRPVGGPADGYVLDCHVCEIDVATGAVVLDWSALAHIPLEETFASVRNPADADGTTPDKAFDAYHLNSIDDDDERLYISSRHTHTVYCIDRVSGAILWRMGGKASDFSIAPDARFAWQHHVRKRANGMFSMFDNHSRSSSSHSTSRGLLLSVDEDARTVTREKEFSIGLLSIAMGSMDLLDNGNWVLGWGTQPVLTEHRPDGKVVLRVEGLGTGSYRGFRQPWTGTPSSLPSVAVRDGDETDMSVYVSWNGATEVRNWRVWTGSSPGALRRGVIVARDGFETMVRTPKASYLAVEGLDIRGRSLARSAAVAVS